MLTFRGQYMNHDTVGYVRFGVRVWEVVHFIMLYFNVRVGRMLLMKEFKPLDNVLFFCPEFLETTWTGFVGLWYNNYR